jgi:two-component system phosphate regulon sensor histidine kinase PhoR
MPLRGAKLISSTSVGHRPPLQVNSPLKTNKLIPLLSLAVLVPLLVLAGLALLGIRAQTQAAWSAAREEAKGIAALTAEPLARELTALVALMPLFPDPPSPGPAAIANDPLFGDDTAALVKLRDDPAAGLSPAGLPRRVLAALRLLELEPNALPPKDLVQLVTRDAPSILTTTVLARLAETHPDIGQPALKHWQQGEQALASWRQGGSDGWQSSAAGPCWAARREQQVAYLTPESLRTAMAEQRHKLPAWAALVLLDGDHKLTSGPTGEVLASAPGDFDSGLRLQVVAASPALIEREVRRQAAWTLSLLALAVGISATALWLMHRIVRQERRLGELKSQFVSSVSHELRAPVGSIRLMAEALHEGKVTGEAAGEFHRLIAGEGARLSHLVENVLDFARIEEGRKRYRFEETDLKQLAADVLRLLEPLAAERGVTLAADLTDCTATVDPAAIQQALVNLLDNAIKFSPPGGTVTVILTSAAAAWSLAVRDEGPGIPATEHERIFERFHRLGNELCRETQGAGIGLSIVKHIVRAHGGSIEVTSRPGEGSVFSIQTEDSKTED